MIRKSIVLLVVMLSVGCQHTGYADINMQWSGSKPVATAQLTMSWTR
jgi:hypothetical protein